VLSIFSVGAIMAGLPFSYVAKYFEWRGSFILLETLLVIVLTSKILMRNVEYKMVATKKKLQ
jgi:sugar phosphate permease